MEYGVHQTLRAPASMPICPISGSLSFRWREASRHKGTQVVLSQVSDGPSFRAPVTTAIPVPMLDALVLLGQCQLLFGKRKSCVHPGIEIAFAGSLCLL
jgi:hypothetical protein